MLFRKILSKMEAFYRKNERKALLITGARQVGKTYAVREFGRTFESFIELNLLENKGIREALDRASDSKEILLLISALEGANLIPGKTLIFLDEVQELKELMTAVKFLVDDGRYRIILSGSLLGVEMKNIRSIPVGYMDIMEMYPLDLEEFAYANGISEDLISTLHGHFERKEPVNNFVHEKMMKLFRLYLVIGGMPAVVSRYLENNNVSDAVAEQQSIIKIYKKDISKYDPDNKLFLEDIFDLIPSELNSKNKRFVMKDLGTSFKLSRKYNSFIWLEEAGVALPTYNVSEPVAPLLLSKTSNLFKLFLSDVGLLASMYMNGIQLDILREESDINFGSVYENAAAQELKSHGFDLYYFNSKKFGELDFIVEDHGRTIPLEIKSGKGYYKHSALNNVLSNPDYRITEGFVFCNDNISVSGSVTYCPIYMLMFLSKTEMPEMFFTEDFSSLNDYVDRS